MTLLNSAPSTTWQSALANAITDPTELFELLDLDKNLLEPAKAAANLFSLKVTREFVSRIQKGNLNDPLLMQLLPLDAELLTTPGYSADPLQENEFNPLPGLLHKYQSRVLVTLVGTCAINCRYCFRRHFPYGDNNPGTAGWNKILDYIAADSSINEVILSGGDPLIANDKMLRQFTDGLNTIAHIKRLRIHSRVPITLPARITPEFMHWITGLKQKPVMVMHCNHSQEINEAVKNAVSLLKNAGITMLNQSVLLKGVNDNVETLIKLSEDLFAIGIQPYYLHALDKIQGAAHFDLGHAEAKQLHDEMCKRLSGYLVPKLVYEQPGAASKLLV